MYIKSLTTTQFSSYCYCVCVCASVCMHAMLEALVLGVELKLLSGAYSYFPCLEMNPLMLSLKMNGLYSSHPGPALGRFHPSEGRVLESYQNHTMLSLDHHEGRRAVPALPPGWLANATSSVKTQRKVTSYEVLLGSSMSSAFTYLPQISAMEPIHFIAFNTCLFLLYQSVFQTYFPQQKMNFMRPSIQKMHVHICVYLGKYSMKLNGLYYT